MQFQKLTSTDAFLVFDLDDAPAVGIVRMAKKVLRDSAELLARTSTYTAASFGLQVSGASAGINALGDDQPGALAAFLAEVRELVDSGRLLLGPGLGVSADGLSELPDADRRMAAFDQAASGASAVAAAVGALGSLDGLRVAIVGNGPITEAAAAAASAGGATPEPQASFDADCDVLLVAGKAGVLEHDLAATVKARLVVPLTPVPVTARALAVLGRADIVVVPDFLSTAAPLLTALAPDGDDPIQRVHDAVAAIANEGTNMWIAAAIRAEEYLSTWQDSLPFGRPLS